MSEKKQAGKTGFTLVELLVVIGIIAVLISILLPMLGKANRIAKITKCSANLRSVGQSFFLYAQENRQMIMPYSGVTDSRLTQYPYGTNAWFIWPNTAKVIRRLGCDYYGKWDVTPRSRIGIMPYIINRKLIDPRVLYCPMDRAREPQTNRTSIAYGPYGTYQKNFGDGYGNWTLMSYDINPLSASRMGKPNVEHWSSGYQYEKQFRSMPITQFPLALDMLQRDIYTLGDNGCPHQPDWNVLCMDGHVDRMRGDKVILRQKDGFDAVNAVSGDYWSEYHYQLYMLVTQRFMPFGQP